MHINNNVIDNKQNISNPKQNVNAPFIPHPPLLQLYQFRIGHLETPIHKPDTLQATKGYLK